MDAVKTNGTNLLDFTSFIKEYYDWYVFDSQNTEVIKKLGLWAIRSPKFNDPKENWHIDRGLLLWGNFGSGKDEVIRLLYSYLNYLRSPYVFSRRIVWEFAGTFSEKDMGYKAFAHESAGNIYYEELALTEENSEMPTREYATFYGNKILIGNEIINIRYNCFKRDGYMSHFTTNSTPEDLGSIYGGRTYSRLREMCNFISLAGKDRRLTMIPKFINNRNQPEPPKAREISMDAEMENKTMLEKHYHDFVEGKTPETNYALVYNMLVSYGVRVCEEENMRMFMEAQESGYAPPETIGRATPSEREKLKSVSIWERARVIAVGLFFQKMKDAGAKSIFGELNIEINLRDGVKGEAVEEIFGGVIKG